MLLVSGRNQENWRSHAFSARIHGIIVGKHPCAQLKQPGEEQKA
jgi:hypothetical protein